MTVTEPTTEPTTGQAVEQAPVEIQAADPDGVVEEDVLVEEISIDGMCGVY